MKASNDVFYLARIGDVSGMNRLIAAGIDVNAQDDNGFSALHGAADYGRLTTCEVLVANGAEIDCRNIYRQSPLHLAALHGHSEVVRFLIEQGADTTVRDNRNKTPLDMAYLNGHHRLGLLLRADKDSVFRAAMIAGDFDLVEQFLCQDGVTIVKEWTGKHLLHMAAHHCSVRIVSMVIEHGLDVNEKDENGQTPLHVAAGAGQEDVVKFLVNSGALVSARDVAGNEPVHLASQGLYRSIVEFLRSKGGDPTPFKGGFCTRCNGTGRGTRSGFLAGGFRWHSPCGDCDGKGFITI